MQGQHAAPVTREWPEGRHENKDRTLNPFIPLALLVIGLAEMVLKDMSVLPTPHTVSTVIAVICLILALISLALTFRLQMRETGKRGRP